MDWQELAATSHYRTAVAVADAIEQGQISEAKIGIEELIEALTRSDKRALKSHLIRLMVHVIKWHTQPEKRSVSWRATIQSARDEIRDIQEDTPSLNRAAIERIWDRCVEAALRDSEAEMHQEPALTTITWAQAFEDPYELGPPRRPSRRKRG